MAATTPKIFSLIAFLFFIGNAAFSQNNKNYGYLLDCFKNATAESAEVEIEGIGTVQSVALSANETEETGLLYFDIPENKKDVAASKMAKLAANQFIQTWKNNSAIVLNKKYSAGAAAIVDLRLHMQIENIDMQVIIIADKDRIYEIMCFRDPGHANDFDAMTDKILYLKCL